MLKLINGLLAAACFVILGSDVLAAAHDIQLRRSFIAEARDRIGLGEAISIAEGRVEGRAMDAKLIALRGTDIWDVDIASRDGPVQVRIDARNGKIIVSEMAPRSAR